MDVSTNANECRAVGTIEMNRSALLQHYRTYMVCNNLIKQFERTTYYPLDLQTLLNGFGKNILKLKKSFQIISPRSVATRDLY